MSLQMIQTLSTTIEAKDAYTRGHSYRVAQYAALIAEELGWTPEEILNLKRATHLHDIGKIGIPDPFLNKPAQLTDDEYNLIKKHTVIGAEILKDITLIPHAAEIARSHHERYDGLQNKSVAGITSATTEKAIRTGWPEQKSPSMPGSWLLPTATMP